MTNVHVMLDLETWGTEPGCDLRSIGACVFDPITGELPQSPDGEGMDDATMFYVATDNPTEWIRSGGQDIATRRYPLIRNPKTEQWWSEQTAEAQGAFTDPVDLADALQRFADWLHLTVERAATGTPVNALIWSHGPTFDPVILAAAYRACRQPEPWHYRAPRDTRTLFDLAGVEDHSAFLTRFSVGTYHHALDDALCQARAVCEAYRMLRRGYDLPSRPLHPDHGASPLVLTTDACVKPDACRQVEAWNVEWTESAGHHWGDKIDWQSALEIARRLDAR